MIASITSLAKALDERDNYTRFHSENVAKYAVKIANKIRMPDRFIEELRLASMLHDIGKIGVRDLILLKPGSLTHEEYEVIKKHPEKGAAILRPIPSLSNIIPYILSHHERFDGNGYPGGLSGDEIPLGARIISVADTYDGITTDRPYRKKKSHEDAIKLMKSISGSQLCPFCIEAFLSLLD